MKLQPTGFLSNPTCFIHNQIVGTHTAVEEAENKVSKITAVLPNVKLPTNHAWMSVGWERENNN